MEKEARKKMFFRSEELKLAIKAIREQCAANGKTLDPVGAAFIAKANEIMARRAEGHKKKQATRNSANFDRIARLESLVMQLLDAKTSPEEK